MEQRQAVQDGEIGGERLAEADAGIDDDLRTVHAGGRGANSARARAVQAVGEQGVIDAIGICGYYAMLAMVLNVENGEGVR